MISKVGVLILMSLFRANYAASLAEQDVINQVAVETTTSSSSFTSTMFATTEFINTTWIETYEQATNSCRYDPPYVQFFIKVVLGEVTGARYCKKDFDCGSGMTCDLFWNLCSPIKEFNATQHSDEASFWSNCTVDADCNDFHYCINGTCAFCGPTTCHTSMDCCSVVNSNVTFECVDLENVEMHSLALQLGRGTLHGGSKGSEEIDSAEMMTFGKEAYGDYLFHHKRCWARCNVDGDCHYNGFPLILREYFGCCNGLCTRKESCVTIPVNFVKSATTTATPKGFVKAVKKIIKPSKL